MCCCSRVEMTHRYQSICEDSKTRTSAAKEDFKLQAVFTVSLTHILDFWTKGLIMLIKSEDEGTAINTNVQPSQVPGTSREVTDDMRSHLQELTR